MQFFVIFEYFLQAHLLFEEIAHIPYTGQIEFKVIADHVRTLTFALADGAVFENVGRGYVLRRLLRRAVRYGRNLNINRPFLAELVDVVVEVMGEFYPYLASKKLLVKEMVTKEEELFQKTLFYLKHLDCYKNLKMVAYLSPFIYVIYNACNTYCGSFNP